MINRKMFLRNMGLCMTGAVALPNGNINANSNVFKRNASVVTINDDLIKEFVSNCHSDLGITKELLQTEPRLIYASYDWGDGDYENGIEASGHMGRRDITEFLIEKGARINFFTLCMLGKFEIVYALLIEYPSLLNALGPHGFTPLHHARKGGERAVKVAELLESKGATETLISFEKKNK